MIVDRLLTLAATVPGGDGVAVFAMFAVAQIVLALVTLAAMSLRRHLSEEAALESSACACCGYDCRDLPSATCPECGRPFALRRAFGWKQRVLVAAGMVLVLAGVAACMAAGRSAAKSEIMHAFGHNVDVRWQIGFPLLFVGGALLVVAIVSVLSRAKRSRLLRSPGASS